MKIYTTTTTSIFGALFSILVFSNISFSQFGPAQNIDLNMNEPIASRSFDLDGDGDMDILSVSDDDNRVVWFENEGGSYGDLILLTDQGGVKRDCYAGDLDGDADLDIIYVAVNDVHWMENLGGGDFGTPQLVFNGIFGGTSIRLADMDNDLDLDVIIASTGDDKVSYCENLGGGTFNSPVVISNTIDWPTCVHASDLDNDGDLDILATSRNDDKVEWYENLGTGTFGSGQVISSNLNGASAVTTADLNNNGFEDVITTSFFGDKTSWFPNLGMGSFGPEEIVLSSINGMDDVNAVDLENDGDIDIVSISFNSGIIYLNENDGTGTFAAPDTLVERCLQCVDIEVKDINNDNLPDLLWTSFLIDKVAYNINLGSNNFESDVALASHSRLMKALELVDVNNDGNLDLFSDSQAGVQLALGRGNGEFDPQQLLQGSSTSVTDFVHGDLDGDGDADLAYGSGNNVIWIENLGNGNFGPETIVSSAHITVRTLFIEDVNGDNQLDILVASSGDDKLAYYLGLGGGNFGSQNVVPGNWNDVFHVACFDINNDGLKDILASSGQIGFVQNWVRWSENLNGTFSADQSIAININQIRDLEFEDLNSDGNMDFAVSLEDQIYWFEGDGNGAFNLNVLTNSVDNMEEIKLGDFDQDGDIDVFSASISDNKLAFYVNLGGGIFQGQSIISQSAYPTCLAVGDIDNDTDIDVVAGYWQSYVKRSFDNYLFHEAQARGRLYIDANQDGILDSNEVGINNTTVIATPQSSFSHTYQNGQYITNFTDTAGTYIIAPDSIPFWGITSDSLTYTIEIDTNLLTYDSLDFGMYPNMLIDSISPSLSFSGARCNDTALAWIDLYNVGGTIPSGYFSVTFDDSITFIDSPVTPDSIIGQTVYWNFDSIPYFSNALSESRMLMPDFQSLGDTGVSILNVYTTNNGIVTGTFTDTLFHLYTCAYDPNDKLGVPFVTDSLGFIPFDTQVFEYTIRFQNTGNDTAQDVRILDQLDPNLDWNTLTHLSSSFPYQLHVNQMGEAEFFFQDIMLPDSNVNFLGSQGYVRFRIHAKPGLTSGTQIFNTAEIYFDLNPAIITNTKIYTLYDCGYLGEQLDSFSGSLCYNETISIGEINDFTAFDWSISGVIAEDTTFIIWQADTAGSFNLTINAEGPSPVCSADTTLPILVYPEIIPTVDSLELCNGDSLFINSNYVFNAGTYVDTLQSATGCDSITSKTIEIYFPDQIQHVDSLVICQGDSLLVHSQYESTAGLYLDTLVHSLGCDSIVGTFLTLQTPTQPSAFDSMYVCQGDSILIYNQFQSVPATYLDTVQNSIGCDSIIGTILTVVTTPPLVTYDSLSICQGDSVLLYNQFQSVTGTYIDTVQNILGCDSVVGTHLTVLITSPLSTYDSLFVCQGDSILLYNEYQSAAGTYIDTVQTMNGCDSIVGSVLSIKNTPQVPTIQLAICDGDSLLIGGQYVQTTGIYYDSLQTTEGCDSIIAYNLDVLPLPVVSFNSNLPDSVCVNAASITISGGAPSGGTYTGNGITGTIFSPSQAGIGMHTVIYSYTDSNGCIASDSAEIYVDACSSLEEIQELGIIVHPNPVDDILYLQPSLKNATFTIRDEQGRLVLDGIVDDQIDIQSLAAGTYTLEIKHVKNARFRILKK